MMLWASLNSVAEGIYRNVCPLYTVDHRDRVYVAGSAIPFNSDGRFLLSAAHMCFAECRQPVSLFILGQKDGGRSRKDAAC